MKLRDVSYMPFSYYPEWSPAVKPIKYLQVFSRCFLSLFWFYFKLFIANYTMKFIFNVYEVFFSRRGIISKNTLAQWAWEFLGQGGMVNWRFYQLMSVLVLKLLTESCRSNYLHCSTRRNCIFLVEWYYLWTKRSYCIHNNIPPAWEHSTFGIARSKPPSSSKCSQLRAWNPFVLKHSCSFGFEIWINQCNYDFSISI